MDLSMFSSFHRRKLETNDAILILGRSKSGKSFLAESLLTHFEANVDGSLANCNKVLILYRHMQPSLQRILNLFPPSTQRLLSRSVKKEWLDPQFCAEGLKEPGGFNLVLFDDRADELSKRDSMDLQLLSDILFVGSHHARIFTICCLQSLGSGDHSRQLRVLAKEFNVFLLMANLPVPAVRYLASFLSPHRAKTLVSLMEAIPRRAGSYLMIDDRLNGGPRFSTESLVRSDDDSIFMVFES